MDKPPDWERGLIRGIAEVGRHLAYMRSKNDNRFVRGYVAGLATGLMRYCLRMYGPRLTFDLFDGLAQEALEHELKKD